MSERRVRSSTGKNATTLEIKGSMERDFARMFRRIEQLEGGRARGAGSSFALPFRLVGDNGKTWSFTELDSNLVVQIGETGVTYPPETIPPVTPPTPGLNADFLDGFDSTYFLDFTHLTNVPVFDDLYVNITGDTMTGDLTIVDHELILRESTGPSNMTLGNTLGTLAISAGDVIMGGGRVSVAPAVATDSQDGIYWDGISTHHAIRRTSGAWSGTFQQLRIDWPEGIMLGAGTIDAAGTGPSTLSWVDVVAGKGLRVTSGNFAVESGAFASSATPFYLDESGNFSIRDKLFFDVGLDDVNGFAALTVIGRIRGAIDNFPVVPTDTNTWYVGQVIVAGTAPDQTAVIQTLDTSGAAATHTFEIDDTVIITAVPGTAGASINGAWRVTAKTTSTFTITSSILAPFTAIANGTYAASVQRANTTASGASGQAVITVASASNLAVGQYVEGTGITSGTQVQIISGTTVTLSANLVGTLSATAVVFYGSARVRELTIGLHPAKNGSPAGIGLRIDEYNYWFLNNQFRVGTSISFMKWDGSSLTTTGIINALGGNFVGKMTVAAGTMAFGTKADPTATFNGLYVSAGNFWYSTGSFQVGGATGITYPGSGAVTIGTNVNITGNITGGSIVIGSGSTSFHVDASANMWLGATTFAAAPFKVSNAGAATASGLAINGSSTFAGSITSSATITGGTVQTAASGNRVVMTGSSLQVINSAGTSTLSLNITAAVPVIAFTGTSGGVTATSSLLLASTASSLALSGQTGLSITANGGTLSIFRDGSNNISITTGGVSVAGVTNFANNIFLSSTNLYLRTADTNHGLVYSSSFGGTGLDGPVLFGYASGVLGTTGSGSVWQAKWDNTGLLQVRGDVLSFAVFRGTGAGAFGTSGGQGAVMRTDSGGNNYHFDWAGGTFRMYVDATLVKTFVIPHPDRLDRLLVHAVSEGPQALVHYTGEGKLDRNGISYVELPGYFASLVELAGRTIQLTPIATPVSLAASWEGDAVFKVVGQPGTRFYWRVDAERRGTAFDVEPLRSAVTVRGDGPYTYIAA